MATITAFEKETIQSHYRSEYFDAATRKARGPIGKIANGIRDMASPRRLGLMAGVIIAGALVAIFLPVTAPALTITALTIYGTALGVAIIDNPRMTRAANAALDKDINNGTLIERYRKEVVDPQLATLPALEAGLKAQSARLATLAEEARTQFNKAAPQAQPEAQAPARKHKIRLHKNAQPA